MEVLSSIAKYDTLFITYNLLSQTCEMRKLSPQNEHSFPRLNLFLHRIGAMPWLGVLIAVDYPNSQPHTNKKTIG